MENVWPALRLAPVQVGRSWEKKSVKPKKFKTTIFSSKSYNFVIILTTVGVAKRLNSFATSVTPSAVAESLALVSASHSL